MLEIDSMKTMNTQETFKRIKLLQVKFEFSNRWTSYVINLCIYQADILCSSPSFNYFHAIIVLKVLLVTISHFFAFFHDKNYTAIKFYQIDADKFLYCLPVTRAMRWRRSKLRHHCLDIRTRTCASRLKAYR